MIFSDLEHQVSVVVFVIVEDDRWVVGAWSGFLVGIGEQQIADLMYGRSQESRFPPTNRLYCLAGNYNACPQFRW